MQPLVIYHANCTDGFGAAYAAWTVLGDDAEYVPMHYGPVDPQELRQMVADREVYILDFSLPRAEMELVADVSARLVWLDHHKTAFEMWLGGIPETERFEYRGDYTVVLDNNKSGALLAWEHFNPNEKPPMVIRHIDDRDRWQFKLGGSRAIHAALHHNKPWTFEKWSVMVDDEAYADMMSIGLTLVAEYNQQIAASVNKAQPCRLGDRPGMAVNTPVHISEVGNELAKASGTYGLVWYFDGATKRAFCSLRSIGEYDVSVIAKQFGGGGHRNAAGFNIDMPTLLGWLEG